MGSETPFSTASQGVENSWGEQVDCFGLFSTACWDGFRAFSVAALSVGFALWPQKSPLQGAEARLWKAVSEAHHTGDGAQIGIEVGVE